MATTQKFGAFTLKDAQGNVVTIQGLTANDVAKIKEYFGYVDTLKEQMKVVNSGQQRLAYKDYYTNDATLKSEMEVGIYYNVPFNSQGEFLEFDKKSGKPKNPQPVATTTDLTVSYYEIVYKNSDDTVGKLGRRSANASMEHVLFDNVDATITANYTFSKNVTCSVVQDSSLNDQSLATAKFVRDTVAAAAHVTAKYYEQEPASGSLVTNELALFPAQDQLAA